MWGMGDVNQEWNVLYNVHKGIVQYYENKKKCLGGGEREGQYLNQKQSQCLKKKKKKKKKVKTEPGLEPSTSGLEKLLSYPLG